MKRYSYDDANLIAYWQMDEPYTSTDNVYTVRDYSIHDLEITVNRIANPDSPKFEMDATK